LWCLLRESLNAYNFKGVGNCGFFFAGLYPTDVFFFKEDDTIGTGGMDDRDELKLLMSSWYFSGSTNRLAIYLDRAMPLSLQ
jgi:hypothetical protein